MLKNILNKIALAIGIFFILGVVMIPGFVGSFGDTMGNILNPLATLFPLHMLIFVLAAITGLYASLIQKYTMDWDLMRRVQERMKNMQKEFKQAQLSNNTQKMKKIEAQRAEMLGDQMAMMKQQFKPMIYISILSIPLFFWAYSVILPVNFAWEDVPGDNSKLITFIEKTQGAEWIKNAKIEKSEDGRAITVSNGQNSYILSLNEDKTVATLKAGETTQEFTGKAENGKINIYATSASMTFPFWGTQKLNDPFFGPFQFWLFWYFLCSIPVSQMTRKALNIGGM